MYLASNASHGLSNLDASHVKKLGAGEAIIEFKGKAGQLNTCTVRDKDTLAYLRHRRRLAGGGASPPSCSSTLAPAGRRWACIRTT